MLLITLLIIVLAATGCGDASPDSITGGPSTSTAITPLTEGSSIRYSVVTIDSNGTRTETTSEPVTMVRKHATLYGRSDVYEWSAGGRPKYMCYEEDGDVWQCDDAGRWDRMPFSGTELPEDEHRDEVQGNTRMIVRSQARYLGEKPMNIAGETMITRGISMVGSGELHSDIDTDSPKVTHAHLATTMHFLPSIGFFGPFTMEMRQTDPSGTTRTLQSITMTVIEIKRR